MRNLLLLLCLTLLASLPARAQQMIEVPTDPNAPPPARSPEPAHIVEPGDASGFPHQTPTVVPPSPSMPLPPPLLAPRPAITPVDVRDARQYHREHFTSLIVLGAVSFGSLYILNASLGAVFGQNDLAIPLVGPFVQMAANHRTPDLGTGDLDAMLALDAVAQLGSVAMVIVGATTTHSVYGRKIALAPSVTPRFAGLTLTGRF